MEKAAQAHVSVEPDANFVDVLGLPEALARRGLRRSVSVRQVGAGPGDIIHIIVSNPELSIASASAFAGVAQQIANAVLK